MEMKKMIEQYRDINTYEVDDLRYQMFVLKYNESTAMLLIHAWNFVEFEYHDACEWWYDIVDQWYDPLC